MLTKAPVHVLPSRDWLDHEPWTLCWCHPDVTQEPGAVPVVIHRAADHRECREPGGSRRDTVH